jgi:hypothetical protein
MPILYGCTVMVFSGPYRVFQERRKSCLPNLGVGARVAQSDDDSTK